MNLVMSKTSIFMSLRTNLKQNKNITTSLLGVKLKGNSELNPRTN